MLVSFQGHHFSGDPTTLGICECITRKLIQFYVQIKIIFVKCLIFMLVATAHFSFATSYDMSLLEWKHFCHESDVCNDGFSRHDIVLPFAYSIMCVIDETRGSSGERG